MHVSFARRPAELIHGESHCPTGPQVPVRAGPSALRPHEVIRAPGVERIVRHIALAVLEADPMIRDAGHGKRLTGLNPNLLPFITQKVTIPRKGKAESLNVAIATAILCDNLLSGK